MDTTDPAKKRDRRISQDDSNSHTENKNDLPPSQEIVEVSSSLGNAFDTIRAQDLLAQEKVRKAKRRARKDRRIQDCDENQSRDGRGRNTFVISQTTFNKIIQYLDESNHYKKVAIIKALKLAYEKGLPVNQNTTGVTGKNISRCLTEAFEALEIQIPPSKKPSLWTLIISHRVMNEAKALDIDLEERFIVV